MTNLSNRQTQFLDLTFKKMVRYFYLRKLFKTNMHCVSHNVILNLLPAKSFLLGHDETGFENNITLTKILYF